MEQDPSVKELLDRFSIHAEDIPVVIGRSPMRNPTMRQPPCQAETDKGGLKKSAALHATHGSATVWLT
jgi:hypothetical protein